MANKRVHEIAKEQGISSKELLAALEKAGVAAKAAASSVDEDAALKALGRNGAGNGAPAAPEAQSEPPAADGALPGQPPAQPPAQGDGAPKQRPTRSSLTGERAPGSGGGVRRVIIDSQAARRQSGPPPPQQQRRRRPGGGGRGRARRLYLSE